MNISYTFYGGSVSSEVGLLVFIDGIIQQYSVGQAKPSNYMEIFDIAIESEVTYELNVLPSCGKAGDVLQLNFVCIDFPTFKTLNEAFLEYQSMSTTISWRLSYLVDAEVSSVPQQSRNRISTITNSIGKYPLSDVEYNVTLYESSIAANNTQRLLRLTANSEHEGNFRTTFFVNNQPAIIDGDISYIEHSMNSGEQLRCEAELDVDSLSNKSLLYAISIRISIMKDSVVSDGLSRPDVFKTDSIIITK